MSSAVGSTSRSASTSTASIPFTAAAGGLFFTQPNQNSPISIYKIYPSNPITFGWNLTSLYSTPASLTLSAFCSANGNTYALDSKEGVIPAGQTTYVWDPYAFQENSHSQLDEATYTLFVQDQRGLSAAAQPGLFQPNQNLKFALYRPADYVPLANYSCAGCSAASHVRPSVLLLCLWIWIMLMR